MQVRGEGFFLALNQQKNLTVIFFNDIGYFIENFIHYGKDDRELCMRLLKSLWMLS